VYPAKSLAALGAAILLVSASQTALAGKHLTSSNAARERAAVSQLRAASNAHRLSAVSRLFAASAVLQVEGRTWHGNKAITTWWHGQLTHRVRLVFESPVSVHGSTAAVVLQRTTRGGDCARGCPEQMTARFTGTRFETVTLERIAPPSAGQSPPSQPMPGHTAVPPPPSGPPPRVTPTIPS